MSYEEWAAQRLLELCGGKLGYDSMFIITTCSYCGGTGEVEIQTKQLQCDSHKWHVGDYITDQMTSLSGISTCHLSGCCDTRLKEKRFRFLYIKVQLLDGKLTNEYEVIGRA